MTPEAERWVAYTYRLIDQGKRGTPEFIAVWERAVKALSADLPSPEVVPPIAIPQPKPVAPEPRKKTRQRPGEDTAEAWQKYLDDLALAGEEDSDEFVSAKYRLERVSRPYIEHPDGAIPHDWQYSFKASGKQTAHHRWLGEEREDGVSHFHHRGRWDAR